MSTGENENDLRKILDLTRFAGVLFLILHCYYYCYAVFKTNALTTGFTDKLLVIIERTGLFRSFDLSKWFALALLVISLFGAQGKKDDKLKLKPVLFSAVGGIVLFFGSKLIFKTNAGTTIIAVFYLIATAAGYLLLLTAGVRLSRIIRQTFGDDIFNE